jgi:cytosine/adenosine deaminase-related metal-dependent hydrolase
MGTAKDSFSARDVYISSLEGYLEGLNSGTTTFVEHAASNWRDDVVMPGYEAARDSGARVWWCHDLLPGFQSQVAVLKTIKSDMVANKSSVSMGLACDMFNWSDESAVEQMKAVIK